jgi:energy-converting hydrogenase Eha subunit E
VLAAGLAFLAAGIGLTTLWVALNTRSWDGFEAVVIPPLVVGVALAAGWACVLGVGLLVRWAWARWWALLTFVAVSAFSGLALFDTVGRVVDDGDTPARHLVAPGSLFTVAMSIVLLLAFAGEPDRS